MCTRLSTCINIETHIYIDIYALSLTHTHTHIYIYIENLANPFIKLEILNRTDVVATMIDLFLLIDYR